MLDLDKLKDFLSGEGINCSKIYNEGDDRYEIKFYSQEKGACYIYTDCVQFRIVNEQDHLIKRTKNKESVLNCIRSMK